MTSLFLEKEILEHCILHKVYYIINLTIYHNEISIHCMGENYNIIIMIL